MQMRVRNMVTVFIISCLEEPTPSRSESLSIESSVCTQLCVYDCLTLRVPLYSLYHLYFLTLPLTDGAVESKTLKRVDMQIKQCSVSFIVTLCLSQNRSGHSRT